VVFHRGDYEEYRLLECYAVKVFLYSVRRLLVSANVVPSSPILVIQIMEALGSFKISILTKATRHNSPEDGILHYRFRSNWPSSGVQIGFSRALLLPQVVLLLKLLCLGAMHVFGFSAIRNE
jgi:hypothetical protein